MPKRTDNRTRLVRAAEKMTYRRGFRQTTLADIAREARMPLGNVYYYFKTKDEIGDAIVQRLLSEVRAMLATCDSAGSPKDRLFACIDAVLTSKTALARGGCPVGSLCTELHKEPGVLAGKATMLFEEQLQWMESQFREIVRNSDARRHAIHLLSALQGLSVLAHTFHDPQLVVEETKELKQWIQLLGHHAGD
jgi:AcrR family transcriptional regulator